MPSTAQLLLSVGEKGTAATQAKVATLSETVNGAATNFKKQLGSISLIAAGAAVIGLGIATTKMAGDFQAGMTTLVTGAGEAQSNLKTVSDGILNLANDTGTSTKQLTDGMFMIESAGFHGKAGLDVLKAAAQGAKVGNADLGVVADATTTILNDFGSTGLTSANSVNFLIATVANGKTRMADLAGSMAMVLPTASAVGIHLNDVGAAMATMTGEGVPAADAATYLRQTMMALDAPSSGTVKALKSIGLSSKDVANELKVSLPDTLKMITDHVGKKFPAGSAEYVAALKNIAGGSKQMQGILDLTGDHMATFQGNVKNISGAVNEGGKSITGWSEVQKDFNFKIDKAREVIETLGIKIGTALLPMMGHLADIVTTYIVPALSTMFTGIGNVVTGIGNFVTWLNKGGVAADAVKGILLILGGAMLGMAASAIPAAITAVIASATAFGVQAVAAGAAAVATIAAAAPFILVGAAIAAVIGIVILMVTHWKQIHDAFEKAPGPVKVLIALFLGPLILAIKAVQAVIDFFAHGGLAKIGQLKDGAIKNVQTMTQIITGNFVEMHIKAAQHADQMKMKVLTSVVDMHMQAVSHLKSQREQVLAQLAATTDPAKRHALEMKLGVIDSHIKMEEEATKHAEAQKAKVAAHMAQLAAEAKHHADLMKMGVIGHIIEMGEVVGPTIQRIVTNFLNKVGELKDQALQKMKDLWTNITTTVSTWPKDLEDLGTNIINGLVNGIKGAAQGAVDAVKNVGTNILGGIKGALGIHSPSQVMADEVGSPITQGIAQGILASQGVAHRAMQTMGMGLAHVGMPTLGLGMGAAGMAAGTSLSSASGFSAAANAASQGTEQHIHIHIGTRELAHEVIKGMPAVVRLATGGRM